MEVSILTRTDSLFAAGITYTDSTGYFNLPVMPFEETMEAIFQTHKPGSLETVCALSSFSAISSRA